MRHPQKNRVSALDSPELYRTRDASTRQSQRVEVHSRGRARRLSFAAWVLVLAGTCVVSCQTVPITGRLAANRFSLEQDMQLGAEAYEDMMSQEPLLRSGPEHAMVNRVMDRLIAACAEYDPGFDWEVRVIDNSEVVNAFALPGGKMAVYTGILPVAEGETGLAVVMGHEIGHALARHGTQRLTSQDAFAQTLDFLFKGDAHALAGQVVGVLQLGYGRSQELESDHIGLILMAEAGYDPREAEAFWGRMAALGGSTPIEWFSTHPSNDRRVEQIRSLLPEAMALFEARRPQ